MSISQDWANNNLGFFRQRRIMTIQAIILRMTLITLFSGIIGFERERNHSHAGLKTHMIVGISATIIALIQQHIMADVVSYGLQNPDLAGVLRSDPARLIAQVVSGIGFLGGGTIIVTKRNVSGLTTAASIWSVAALGLALGMGYFETSIAGFCFILVILVVTKKLQSRIFVQKLRIEYLDGMNTVDAIIQTLSDIGLEVVHTSYNSRIFGDEKIFTSIFEVNGDKAFAFDKITNTLMHNDKIISVQSTNLE